MGAVLFSELFSLFHCAAVLGDAGYLWKLEATLLLGCLFSKALATTSSIHASVTFFFLC